MPQTIIKLKKKLNTLLEKFYLKNGTVYSIPDMKN